MALTWRYLVWRVADCSMLYNVRLSDQWSTVRYGGQHRSGSCVVVWICQDGVGMCRRIINGQAAMILWRYVHTVCHGCRYNILTGITVCHAVARISPSSGDFHVIASCTEATDGWLTTVQCSPLTKSLTYILKTTMASATFSLNVVYSCPGWADPTQVEFSKNKLAPCGTDGWLYTADVFAKFKLRSHVKQTGTNIKHPTRSRISNFQGLVALTLTMDRVILHTAVHHLLTSMYTPNFIQIEETLWTDVRTYGHMRLALLGRLVKESTYKRTMFYRLHLIDSNCRTEEP